MWLETAVSVSLGWLWQKLADTAENKDELEAIKDALEKSIDHSYRLFQAKHPLLVESFFNEEFLKQHVCPELLKFLTRNQVPDTASVIKAFPNFVVFASENEYRSEIEEFFNLVMESMKLHATLQEIINRRQIEETHQITKQIQETQKTTSKLMDQRFDELLFGQEDISAGVNHLLAQNTERHYQAISAINDLKTSLPDSKGNEFDQLITNQLDRSRDLIKDCRVKDAYDLLISLEKSVTSTSDNYTRFRLHTNLGTCYLLMEQAEVAAEQYLTAFNFAKDEEKAVTNRIRAYMITNNFDYGLQLSEEALQSFPNSGIIWAFNIKLKESLNNSPDNLLLPDELENDISVILVRADINLARKEFEESYKLAKKAFDQDKSSLDAKRLMLISSISWATTDTVKSYYHQIPEDQRKALTYAVDSFEDIFLFLKNIQSKSIIIEIALNLATASKILGNRKNNNLITYLSSLYPHENALISYKIKELEESGDIDSIRKLTENILANLEKPVLFLLADISANKGDLDWNSKIIKFLENKTLVEEELDELLGLKICANWIGGNKSQALILANKNLAQIEASKPLLSFYIRMLDENGEQEERDNLLLLVPGFLNNSNSIDIILFADLYYDLKKYFEAANLYCRLIESPTDDYLTRRYINSLINSEQRAKAAAVLEKLPKNIREQSFFRRAEANLARSSGDLETLENLLAQEILLFPKDSYVAINYAATLYRKKQADKLKTYLSKNPLFDPIIETNEIEFSKYQIEFGFEYQALLRMYILFRSYPNNSEIAGYYFLSLLHVKQFENLKSLEKIATGTAVYLESGLQKRIVVIEPEHLTNNEGWPECVSENSTLAKKLIGRNKNDLIEITIGHELHEAKIINIVSMFMFALDNTYKVIANSVSTTGPVWSINVKKTDGEYDFGSLWNSLKNRCLYVEHVLNEYNDKSLPLQLVSNALGTDIVTLFLDWPYKQCDLFVSTGIHEELESSKELINKEKKLFVIDLTALIELEGLGLLHKSLEVIKKPLVSTSLRDQLQGLILALSKTNLNGHATEVNGKISYQEIPQDYLNVRKNLLLSLLHFVDNHCEITPVLGPTLVTEVQTSIGELLDPVSHDIIYLALERKAILLSEDGGFRYLAHSIGVTENVCIQPLLMALRDRELISKDRYSEYILDKLNRHHDFISITADDLLWAVKLSPNQVSPIVETAIQTFKKPSLDLVSGINVCSVFLEIAANYLKPDVLYQYYQLLLNNLAYERKHFLSEIKESLRISIVSSLAEIKPKNAKKIIRIFGDRLNAPEPQTFRLKPIPRAIRSVFYGHNK